MTENHLVSLIARHLSGELTEEETGELRLWAAAHTDNQLLLNRITDEGELEKELDRWRNINATEGYEKWVLNARARRRGKIWRLTGWSVAASLLIAVAVFSLTRKADQHTPQTLVDVIASQTVLPGRNTAVLTLANGQVILLDSAGNGELAKQGNVRLVKRDSGSLSYQMSGNNKSEAVAYNTLTTPRAGQYQLTLPDGSHVWLNNVSSLRYPTSFIGKDRTVELTGEAYFEIAKDVTKPFLVKVKDQTIEVLGTSFNIMAYPEEGSPQTTLLTGMVRVKAGGSSVKLRPDEQAQINEAGKLKVLKNVPSQEIVSWKDGVFYFGRASFAAVMRQLARWYNVDVIYKGKVPDMEFGGKIDRSLPLNELLKFLDKNQIHFRLEGHDLIVLPS
jgi:ferric-dicitrate binding protein FerR (iron transport regulator)